MTINHTLFLDANFLNYALQIDIEFANKAKEKRCPHCKNKLHFGRYQRKGRLFNVSLPEEWGIFHSLCCSSEICRKRVRPLSLRYAGKSPYSPGLFLLAELIKARGSQRSIIALSKELKVSERTIRRWLSFWKKVYSKSTWWRKISSIYMLSGKTLNDLWNSLLTIKTKTEAFQYLIIKSAEIWDEFQLFVGDIIPAKDA